MAVNKAVTTTDLSGFLKPEMAEAYFEDIKRAVSDAVLSALRHKRNRDRYCLELDL